MRQNDHCERSQQNGCANEGRIKRQFVKEKIFGEFSLNDLLCCETKYGHIRPLSQIVCVTREDFDNPLEFSFFIWYI